MNGSAAYQSTPRVARGVPTGGEWRPRDRDDSGIIEPADSDPWLARLNALRDAGYVPATVVAAQPAADPDGPSRWWDQALLTAEYGHETGEYPQMPDDNTPSMTTGNSLSGHRRTHRIAYSGGDLTLRMPSKAAITRFAGQSGAGTFDVPVSVDGPTGRPMQGWVRCTPGSTGEWDCQALGLDGDAETYVAEGVAAILESRHPRQALTTVGDLLERRRARLAAHGTPTRQLDTSSWIHRVGYDRSTHTMLVELEGRPYGYRIDEASFNLVANSYSPGNAFNRAVKGQATRVDVTNCTHCGRFTSQGTGHICPTAPQDRADGHRNTSAWQHAAQLAADATTNVVPLTRRADTPNRGLLVNRDGDPRRVGVAEWMQREVEKAAALDLLPLTKPTEYGPGVTRGFTAAVASDIEPFADETHVEDAYRGSRINGDRGTVAFCGLDSGAAKALYDKLPAENLGDQATEWAPTVGNFLAVAARNPGSVELVGDVNPPSSPAEKVVVSGLLLYTSTDDPVDAQRQARLAGVKAGRGPATLRRVSSPWRDGRQAWLMRW